MDEEVTLKESIQKGPEVGGSRDLDAIEIAPLRDYFGVERPLPSEEQDLKYLSDWAGKQGAKTKGEVFQKLKALEIKLGAPPTSENRIKHMVSYLKIDAQIEDLLLEQSGYMR